MKKTILKFMPFFLLGLASTAVMGQANGAFGVYPYDVNLGTVGTPNASYIQLRANAAWWNIGNIGGKFSIYSGGASNNPSSTFWITDQGVVAVKTGSLGEVLTGKNGQNAISFQNGGNAWWHARNNAGNLEFSNGGNPGDAPLVYFTNTNQVSIGTSTPPVYSSPQTSPLLFVNGKIGAKEVVVSTTDWSDYVFDESYKLPSLEEVDAYIKTNKHLPAVPSEKEVVENGVNTGEMLKTHMRKIEELTLYVIELEKKYNSLAETLKK